METLKNAIEQGVPLIIAVEPASESGKAIYSQGFGHAVVVVGLSDDQQSVIVMDPWDAAEWQFDSNLAIGAEYIWTEE